LDILELQVTNIVTFGSKITMNILLELYKIKRTVFTFREISLLFSNISYPNLRRRLNYYHTKGNLIKLRRGIYAKENYNPLEFSGKIFTPSYISLESVLFNEGIIFQPPQAISVVSYLTRRVKSKNIAIQFRKTKKEILFNREGVEEKDGYFIADRERAFLDTVFLYKDFYFDNLRPLNWDKINQLSHIYQSASLEKRTAIILNNFKNEIR